ncbi:MAG: RluA family pseudouridine synthase [Proteobacteria bacterium]|nr:RluA family pseudouridine synthase [Pseudomonadota bacterium]NOG59380.1 RluA family pseudouridine synthase [Pseudomonadota bacterium]
MKQNHSKKINSKQIVISDDHEGQRIDNFLMRYFGKIPKSRIYKMLRKGEVRVNKGRTKQTYKLKTGDTLRLPPVYLDEEKSESAPRFLQEKVLDSIIFEDEGIIIINKPAGIVVHSGSGQAHGIIEAFRAIGGIYESLELVHRLDKDTSGCLILAKSIPVLRQLHEIINKGDISKTYTALLAGQVKKKKMTINRELSKTPSNERVITVEQGGKDATTIFHRETVYENASLVNVDLITGRTHQIRVHSESIGHPVLGDDKYGNRILNREYRKKGLKRMFLHAKLLSFLSPVTGKKFTIEAPLEDKLLNFLEKLNTEIH